MNKTPVYNYYYYTTSWGNTEIAAIVHISLMGVDYTITQKEFVYCGQLKTSQLALNLLFQLIAYNELYAKWRSFFSGC